jgi:hypothetical protein
MAQTGKMDFMVKMAKMAWMDWEKEDRKAKKAKKVKRANLEAADLEEYALNQRRYKPLYKKRQKHD